MFSYIAFVEFMLVFLFSSLVFSLSVSLLGVGRQTIARRSYVLLVKFCLMPTDL